LGASVLALTFGRADALAPTTLVPGLDAI